MTIITRNTLSDWETYKSDNLNAEEYKLSYSYLDLPNGPYASLDDAKTEASGILDIYTSVTASDLYESCELELDSEKNTLIIKNVQKTVSDEHRPLAEAGSPLDTLNVEFNILQYMNDIKTDAKASWTLNNYKYNGALALSLKDDDPPLERQNDSLDRFFTSINVTNEESNYKNSFVALKKTIEDPSSLSIVHFLNHLNLTFVFQTSDTSICDDYGTYSTDLFSVTSQETKWHSSLQSHFGKDSPVPFPYHWHCREMYHLTEDYYAITISTNESSSAWSTELMIDLADNFDNFHWDWENYPGNLYVGNVCKILS